MTSFSKLHENKFSQVPHSPGVYWVCAGKGFKPDFINPGTGGFFRGQNPNVEITELERRWIKETEVLYIGQSTDLRRRLRQYTLFGLGRPVGHRGGRYIWQIKDALHILSVRWEEDANPERRERSELSDFEKRYGRLPFANLRTNMMHILQKDFDGWNVKKKQTHAEQPRLYTIREVWWCRLGINIGSEQDGSGKLFLRPIVILRGFGPATCLVVPLTTSPRQHPLRIPVGEVQGEQATALLSQIRIVDTRRLVEKVGFLDKKVFERLRKAVRALF